MRLTTTIIFFYCIFRYQNLYLLVVLLSLFNDACTAIFDVHVRLLARKVYKQMYTCMYTNDGDDGGCWLMVSVAPRYDDLAAY